MKTDLDFNGALKLDQLVAGFPAAKLDAMAGEAAGLKPKYRCCSGFYETLEAAAEQQRSWAESFGHKPSVVVEWAPFSTDPVACDRLKRAWTSGEDCGHLQISYLPAGGVEVEVGKANDGLPFTVFCTADTEAGAVAEAVTCWAIYMGASVDEEGEE